jgi:hypothetical protein
MGYPDRDPQWWAGWRAHKRYEVKRRPLWILVGFLIREIALFTVWALFRP